MLQNCLKAIPEKNTWERETAGDIFFYGWLVRKVFKLYGSLVRPNLITWVVGISLHGRARKNIICQKREKFLLNLAKKTCRA